MGTPKTLMDMAGIGPAPFRAEDSAVVMIDCQNEYVDGALALPGVEAALAEGQRLIQRARSAGVPVIHVQHRGQAGGLFDPAKPAFAIADAVRPAAGEAVVEKPLPNALAKTDLDRILKESGRKHLVVAGFMTHLCVSSTVRAALDLGYRCTVVAAACATRDLPDGEGGVVAADDLHRAELVGLSDRFASIVPKADALKAE